MTPASDDVYELVASRPGPAPGPGSAADRPPSDLVRSVSRALALLEVVGSAQAPISAKAVARRTGVNLSTTYHLLRTLCWEGYLVRLPGGDFCLGTGIARRYRELVTSLGAPAPMRQVLNRLSTATGHTCFLGRLVDGRVTVTDVVRGTSTTWTDQLSPGFDEAAATPLAQVLLAPPPPPGLPAGTSAGLVVEDGRLRADLSCAVLPVRRGIPGQSPVPPSPGCATNGDGRRWAVGLLGPLGAFAGGAPALRALVRAAEDLATTA
jgi:hypothetical protein